MFGQRSYASESGPGKGLNQVRLLRPLVAQAHDLLRERFESGGSAEAYLRDRARLADSVVIGLLHIASISSGMRDGSMVAPLAAIAAGGYGRGELAPGSDLDLLFLLPESSSSRAGTVAPATRACVGTVVASAASETCSARRCHGGRQHRRETTADCARDQGPLRTASGSNDEPAAVGG